MSTKRAVFITKDYCLLSKTNQQLFGQLQYNNINLNQNNKCEALSVIGQSHSTNLFDKIQSDKESLQEDEFSQNVLLKPSTRKLQSYKIYTVGFCNHNIYETSKNVSWRKNNDFSPKSNLYSAQNNYLQKDKEYKWQSNNGSGSSLNKSTLSLHIEAYENANITQNFVDENIGGLKETKQSPFAFSRQQQKEEEESMEAEVMAFKLSQRAMNFNGMKSQNTMLKFVKHFPRFITTAATTTLPSISSPSFLIPSSTIQTTTFIAPFSYSTIQNAKKQKRNFKKQQKIEIIEIDDDDDDNDNDDDVIDEKTALKAKGILHKGVGEAEEIIDDGLPKDFKHKSFKLTSRRLDTLLNRTSGKSSAEVEKIILSGMVRINDQIEKKKAYNVSKRDDIEVWLEPHPENSLLANAMRIKILNYVLKQHGYDIECQIWSQQLIENWRHSESSGTSAAE